MDAIYLKYLFLKSGVFKLCVPICGIRVICAPRNTTVGSHSSHVPYARELCETSIYVADTAAENRRTSIHQPTTHTYRNAVILVPID
jgi:hypothetical protein